MLLLGASVRAAAYSARRAGLDAQGIDLFADRDLAAIASAEPVPHPRHPAAPGRARRGGPPGPWLDTGCPENHPALVERIARTRPLWGVDASILRALRDPVRVAAALRRARLPAPEMRDESRGLPRDGSWLVKPLRSAGGRKIRPLGDGAGPLDEPVDVQERAAGTPLAALFVGRGCDAAPLGATWQWLGRPGAPFGDRGSVGPWPLAPAEAGRIAAVGRVPAAEFSLTGLFGMDLVLRAGWPWPVEVNPRYMASVGVLELTSGRALLADRRRPPPTRSESRPWPTCPGPARFRAGEPDLTGFARGPTLAACPRRPERHRARWRARPARGAGSGCRPRPDVLS